MAYFLFLLVIVIIVYLTRSIWVPALLGLFAIFVIIAILMFSFG